MGHSGPPVDSQPWGRAPKTREHTSRAGGIPTGRGGRAPPFLKRGPEGPVRHQSRRGDLPGREEYHRPSLAHGPARKRSMVQSDWGESFSMWWSVRRPLFPYKVGHPHMPLPGLQGDLGILSILAARYATIRSVVTPVVLVFANRTRPPAAPTPTPVCPSTPPPTRQSRRLTVRGVDAWLCGEIDLWICRPVLRANLHEGAVGGLGRGYLQGILRGVYTMWNITFRRRAIIAHTITIRSLSTATRPSHPANWSTPRHTTHTKWATCTPHAPIRGHPRPSWRSPGRLAASPSARVPPPIPARLSPRRLASPHLTWPTGQFPSPARTHATLRGHRTPACLAPRRERRPVSRPRPTGAPAQRGRPSCVQTFCGPKVIRGDAHRPTASWRPSRAANWSMALCRARGPGRPPCLDPARVKSTRCRIHSVLGWVSPAKSNGQLANEVGRKRRRRDPGSRPGVHPRGPLQPPGAAGPQQGYLTAYTTRLVTSVVCRGFIPARGDIAIRQPAPRGFSLGAVASLLRCMARRPIRIQLRRAGQHRRVPARILT
ncbi:hypothetical protein AAWM_11221 [Aspergillus awamori]|uniref:Uncharacterized protein n=1 Tax=Aspergillus awamori TaxID=105351 RepID=A0A401L9Y2_ASPAW|nr:hypothetical protein AAWM_11221 [Aspergillus awamori]